jgi:hypothetical protein
MSDKRSKMEVDFEWIASKEPHCGECVHFIDAERKCKLVEGRILPGSWCKLFEREK